MDQKYGKKTVREHIPRNGNIVVVVANSPSLSSQVEGENEFENN